LAKWFSYIGFNKEFLETNYPQGRAKEVRFGKLSAGFASFILALLPKAEILLFRFPLSRE